MLRTITALEHEGMDVRVLVLNFEVPNEEFDLMAAVKAAALEYCQTEEGKKTYEYNCRNFNWADFEMNVPDEICARHGFSVLASPVADLVVDWDEQLVDKDDLFQDKGERIKDKVIVSSNSFEFDDDLGSTEERGDWSDINGLPMGIVDATYVSVWDGGFKVENACKVNRQTGEIFDIAVSDVDADALNVLEDEYVRFADGTEIAAAEGCLVQIDTLLDIDVVRKYMDTVRLDDYDLGGCEITEDDLYAIRERVNDSGGSLEDVVHQYLLEVREVLDDNVFPLKNYDEAVRHLCEVLNERDDELDLEGDKDDFLEVAEFVPIFKSENYFGIYVWHDDSNEYYLVNRNTGEHTMVLGDSFEFIGKNTLDCMKDEKILHVANTEWMRYLVDFSLQNVQDFVPEQELRGIAVLEAALREAVQKEGKYMMGRSLMERLDAAERSAASQGERTKDKGEREKVSRGEDLNGGSGRS